MSDRGMKKWAPFSSLIEQSTCLEKMRYTKNKIEKPTISSDRALKINQILSNCHDEIVTITYFYNGYIYDINTKIINVDKTRKIIKTDDGEIALNAIIDINSESYSNNLEF